MIAIRNLLEVILSNLSGVLTVRNSLQSRSLQLFKFSATAFVLHVYESDKMSSESPENEIAILKL